MKDGFVKVAAATPKIKVADTQYNAEAIINEVKEACSRGEDCSIAGAVYYRIFL